MYETLGGPDGSRNRLSKKTYNKRNIMRPCTQRHPALSRELTGMALIRICTGVKAQLLLTWPLWSSVSEAILCRRLDECFMRCTHFIVRSVLFSWYDFPISPRTTPITCPCLRLDHVIYVSFKMVRYELLSAIRIHFSNRVYLVLFVGEWNQSPYASKHTFYMPLLILKS